jgi:hypothetical protein
MTTVKNKVIHPKACFTIKYHLCHIDDQCILAAIVHVVNIYLMQSPNQNLPLSKEEGIWKRKIGV